MTVSQKTIDSLKLKLERQLAAVQATRDLIAALETLNKGQK